MGIILFLQFDGHYKTATEKEFRLKKKTFILIFSGKISQQPSVV